MRSHVRSKTDATSLRQDRCRNTKRRARLRVTSISYLHFRSYIRIRFGELLDWFGLGSEDTHLAAIPAEWMVSNMKSSLKQPAPIIRQKKPDGRLSQKRSRPVGGTTVLFARVLSFFVRFG